MVDSEVLYIRVPGWLKETIAAAALDTGDTMSGVARRALVEWARRQAWRDWPEPPVDEGAPYNVKGA